MLSNYFKTALRNLLANKPSSFINIAGLAMGMAVALLIGLWVYDECTFNASFGNYHRIARVMRQETVHGDRGTDPSQPIPLGTELRSSFKDDFTYVVMATQPEDHILAAGMDKFRQKGNFMQPEAPDMFSLRMLKGSRSGLTDPHSILLSETLSRKLFGRDDPLNKTLTLDNKSIVKVTGVYEDLPGNSAFGHMEFVAPWDLYVSSNEWMKDLATDWNNNFLYLYTQLAPGADFEKVSARIKDLKKQHADARHIARDPALLLQPMSKWHLYSKYENGLPVTSEELKFVWFYSLIGIFVLLLACINFTNLSTARSEKRAKEVGIRKAIGSLRGQLIRRFFSESLLIAFLSFIVAVGLAVLLLPWFNGVAGKKLSIGWDQPLFWTAGLGFTAITGLMAGAYPALYLSSFQPVKVLKGTFRAGRWSAIPRKALVVLQFTISITLIIGTILVYRQVQFAKDRPVGYSRQGLLELSMASGDYDVNDETFRNELKNTGAVTEMAEGSAVTGIWSENSGFDWKGKDPSREADFGTLSVTPEYGRTIGWQITDGRDFSRGLAGDSAGIIINEAALRFMGLKDPVGQIVKWNSREGLDGRTGKYSIIGVVRDMVMRSPFEPAYPTIFFMEKRGGATFMRIDPALGARNALSKIEKVFKKMFPAAPFDYSFVDEEYALKFAAEERIGKLAGFFTLLAIFISCLGLFGLASFVAAQRTREIGVRKVLGASVSSIWRMLSWDFLALVFLSCLVAIPLAYGFLHQWLQQYAYRTELSWWIFGASAAGALSISLLTISFQIIKAAMANPVSSLRSD